MPERKRLLEDHAVAMYGTLRLPKNASKGHWRDTTVMDLLKHLEEEHSEFIAALWGYLHHGEPLENVISEGADISNITAMIVDNCTRGVYRAMPEMQKR